MGTVPEMSIGEFYAGKNVFITGATGFLGKVLIEKLLRSCPSVGKLYVLIRPKKSRSITERLGQLTDDQLYDVLKKTNPTALEDKLVPINGDVMELNLGLSEADRNVIVNEVNVIFHVAASVRFDDPLKYAVILNARGTREVAQLALDTKHLDVLIHISTAYSNCYMTTVEEKLYPAPFDWRKTIEIVERCSSEELVALTQKFLGKYPNTYTFTKALGEHVVNDMCNGKIPTKIIRPSIVISTLNEPVSGWLDNFNGPVSLLIACGKGIMRCSYQNPNVSADFMPVDVAIKIIIVASWELALRQSKEVEIMHCTSNYHKWVTIGEIINMGKMMSADIPFNDILWVPKGNISTSRLLAYFKIIVFQLFPAMFLDLILKLNGQKAFLTKLQKKIYVATLTLRFFSFQEWNFANDKLLALEDKLVETDVDTWKYDFKNHDIQAFFKSSMLGARRYLLKESDETIPKAKKMYKRMLWLDRITMFLFYSFLLWLLLKLEVFETGYGKIEMFAQNLFTIKN